MSSHIRSKEYVLIVLGQACCLFVGLLLQHHQIAAILSKPWTQESLRGLWLVEGITFLWVIVVSATMLYLQVGRQHDKLDTVQCQSDARVLQRSQALIRTRDAVIFAMARLADYRDHETGNHLERISAYSTALATELAHHPKFADRVTPSFIRLIGISSALHDIGKIGIEDSILHKPGPLTPGERDRMKAHALLADECLREIQQRMGHSSLLDMGRLISVAHHERWDGLGYPYGLSGEMIPLEARIVAVADVYDALATRRVYKESFSHDVCVELIRQEAGRHFDPDIVEAWLKIEGKFLEIGRRYADRESHDQPPAQAQPEAPALAAAVSAGWQALFAGTLEPTDQEPMAAEQAAARPAAVDTTAPL